MHTPNESIIDQNTEPTSNNTNEFDVSKITTQLKIWGERLLDLTKGNPLLGINRSRVSKLLVTTPDAETLFKMLVIDEASIKLPLILIKKKREKQTSGQTKIEEVDELNDEPECTVDSGDVDFEGEPKTLHRLIKRIYDNGRSTVEERGVTTLHLTFGILYWEDPVLGESSSPLLMIPCQLENLGPNSHMRLKILDEELQVNPALEFYLRKKQHIELPKFSEEPTPESLNIFLTQVRDCVKEQHWKIDDKSWLSTFSFESLVIYKDLQAMADLAKVNPLIAALARARTITEGSEALGEELDDLEVPKIVPIPVMPADASQLKALTLAESGRHIVIKGPPGTGKSQTISNLIADALGKGKKVLFVSAKMAALNVVHDRLSKIGLGRFCLEAHSTKAGKLKIIEELKRTLEMPFNGNGSLLEEQLEELKKVKTQLNNYVKEVYLHRDPLGITIYQAIGKLDKLHNFESLEFDLPWGNLTTINRDQFGKVIESLENLSIQSNVFDKKAIHPWRGFSVKADQPVASETIKKNLQILKSDIEIIQKSFDKIKDLLTPIEQEFRLGDLKKLSDTLNSLIKADGLPRSWLTISVDELKELVDILESAVNKSEEYQAISKEYKKITTLPTHELLKLLDPIKKRFSSWTHVINPSYWQWKSSIRSKFPKNTDISYSALKSYIKVARDMEAINDWFNKNSKTLTKYVSDPILNSELLRDKIIQFDAVRELNLIISQNLIKKPKKEVLDISEDDHSSIAKILEIGKNEECEKAIVEIELNWSEGFIDENNIESSFFSTVTNRCSEILSSMPRMHEWIVLKSLISKCNELGLSSLLFALEKTGAENAPEIFEKRFYSQWIESLLNTNPTLIGFIGPLREKKIDQFKDLDRKLQISMLKRIQYNASEPAMSVVGAKSDFGNGGEVGILRKELQKRKRIKPLRRLFNEIPHVLQALKPCMLMSPVSVSTFLKPGSVNFDLVVFDEASQLPTSEAIPSILRGKQIIVAGDENQLPPTSFFLASSIFEDEDEIGVSEELEPLESLLNDCIAIEPVFLENRIIWHYRSKDERLIQFSNRYFYNNSLITFPASTTNNEGRGVHLVYTEDGIWDRGRSRTNRVEAKKVAELVIEQFKKYPERSLGVASMNASQKEAIEEALDELISKKPELQIFRDTNRPEPFFVKSLENVQGDERDTIIICLGYAKTSTGALSLNFGPLNSEGGWRRLNVLVTRAKWQTILVASLRSHELNAINPLNKGAIMLRNYIQYAEENGKLPPDPVTTTNEETNDFEDSIATSLRDRGLDVDEQVGASEYRIDLAIRDPRDKNRYIMAVECDGATYHHTKTARDRDILRQEVLQSQGWKIYRVWSTDWFRDREEALKGILSAFELAKKAPVKDSVQATTLYPQETQFKSPNDAIAENPSSQRERLFKAGIPYRKCILFGKKNMTKELLNINRASQLSGVIGKIVEVESPIHTDIIIERLKEIYGVSRAGANIQKNVQRAINIGTQWRNLINKGNFLYKNGNEITEFRVPSQGVIRGINQIAPGEIKCAVLYLIEDQFGFAREQIPKAILEIFGIGKNRTEPTEIIDFVIDRLLREGKLNLSGHTLYLK